MGGFTRSPLPDPCEVFTEPALTEAPFVDLAAPPGVFERIVVSLPELEAALAEVDPRWALDVVLALDDLVDAQ